MSGIGKAHTKPPEGVIKGESIPLENQQDDFDESMVRELMNKLKQRGEPYVSMKEKELRGKAEELLERHDIGVDY